MEAAAELIKHFQMDSLRTILRNLDKLAPEDRLKYYHLMLYLSEDDLMRFRNDLNANVSKLEDPRSRSMSLMLMATIGRALEPSVFTTYSDDIEQPLMVRLAAAGGLIKVQNPANYQKFHELANEAIYDPANGRNDFAFTNLKKADNTGFYLYTRGQLDVDKPADGVIMCAILMAENESTDVYEKILDMRKRKWVPMLIDRAVQVGGVDLLELMAQHKTTKKKFVVEISSGLTAAKSIAQYRSRFMDMSDPTTTPLGAVVPFTGKGSGSAEGGGE